MYRLLGPSHSVGQRLRIGRSRCASLGRCFYVCDCLLTTMSSGNGQRCIGTARKQHCCAHETPAADHDVDRLFAFLLKNSFLLWQRWSIVTRSRHFHSLQLTNWKVNIAPFLLRRRDMKYCNLPPSTPTPPKYKRTPLILRVARPSASHDGKYGRVDKIVRIL